ncbi:MAG: tetratricopeptide repeat protein [Planctomycetes bacterium]|nr:tetratricopeptide repeat protein [Planctomycetota bacterium]
MTRPPDDDHTADQSPVDAAREVEDPTIDESAPVEADEDRTQISTSQPAGGQRPAPIQWPEEADAADKTLIDSQLATTDRAGAPADQASCEVREEGGTTRVGAHSGRTIIAGGSDDERSGTVQNEAEVTYVSGRRSPGGNGRRSHGESSGVAAGSESERYDLVEEFAHGGMGRIWLANDVRIHREVAYKELLPRALRDPDVVARFVEEAQVTGQLEHPSIVPVYELGRQQDGTPFYSMKLVRGITMRDAIKRCHALPAGSTERRLAFVRVLREFIAVCNALGFAHERGVIHRDIKPLNVMLGDFGETIVLDWGMAKILPESALPPQATAPASASAAPEEGDATLAESRVVSTVHDSGSQEHSHSGTPHSWRRHSVTTDARTDGSRTEMGSIMGTPNYMSPEQALGLVDDLDTRSDIYSLGAMLYEILTGQPPVPKGLKLPQKLRFIAEERMEPPRKVDPTIAAPMDAVCLKALARRKDDRYQTALALAADVEAYLADEPVSCYREPWHVRTRRWVRRHRTLVTSAAAVLVVLLAGWLAWSLVESRRIDARRTDAELAVAEARAAVERGNYDAAENLLTAAQGKLAGEGALSTLEQSVRTQLTDVRRLRESDARRRTEQKLAEARTAAERGDHAAARTALTAAAAVAGREPRLKQLSGRIAAELSSVEQTLRERAAVDAAQADFVRFEELADAARFYGSVFLGESVEAYMAEAKHAALDALDVFDLREGNFAVALAPREPQAGAQEGAGLEHLTDEQAQRLRRDVYELFLILSRAEPVLAWGRPEDERRAAGEQALDWLAQAKALDLPTRALLIREAVILGELGRDVERDAAVRAAEALALSTALDFYLLGEDNRLLGRLDEALWFFQNALLKEPDHFWAMHFTGLCQLLREEPEAAVASFTACVSRKPEFVFNYLARGVAFAELDRFPEALADFDQALALDPEPMPIYLNRGATYLRRADAHAATQRPDEAQRDFDLALADFRRAASLEPQAADPHTNLGEAYRRRGERAQREEGFLAARPFFEQAVAELSEAQRLAADDATTYAIRGDVFRRLENYDAAIRDLRRAAELEQRPLERSQALTDLGRVYYGQERWDAARESFEDAIQAAPERPVEMAEPDPWELLGETLLRLNQEEAAVAAFTRFLERAKPLPVATADLTDDERQLLQRVSNVFSARGLARAKLGRYQQAMEDYTRALELNPAAVNMLTRRGWAIVENGLAVAEADFDEAVRLNPEDADSWLGRGYVRALAGKHAAAVSDAAEGAKLARKQIEREGATRFPLLFNAATIYSKSVAAAENDAQLPPERRTELAADYTREAIALLQEAAGVAGDDYRRVLDNLIATDKALDPIRERPEFREAFGSVRG